MERPRFISKYVETYSFNSFNPKFSCMFFNRFPFFLTQVICDH